MFSNKSSTFIQMVQQPSDFLNYIKENTWISDLNQIYHTNFQGHISNLSWIYIGLHSEIKPQSDPSKKSGTSLTQVINQAGIRLESENQTSIWL